MRKTILITGATGGIGKAAAIELAKRNCNLILVARNEVKLQQLNARVKEYFPQITVTTELVDLSELESVRTLTTKIKSYCNQLDGLIHAAGTFENERKVNSDGIELMFATNHLGPSLLTLELLDLLKASNWARVMTIASPPVNRINFDDVFSKTKFTSLKAYDASKTAHLLFTFKLAQIVSWTFVSVFAFHPGIVKSNILNNMPPLMKYFLRNVAKDPESLSKVIAHFMLNSFENTLNAKHLKHDGTRNEPSLYFQRLENLNRIWELSQELIYSKQGISA